MSAPIELVPSRTKWWVMIIVGVGFAAGMLISFGVTLSTVLVAALSAGAAALGAAMLLPGANALRIGDDGFEIVQLFRATRFRWSQVSDFALYSLGQSGDVVAFKAAGHQPGLWARINGAMLGERNAYLPDTYGMAAADLARLMTERHETAMSAKQPSG